LAESLVRATGSLFGRSAEVSVWSGGSRPTLFPEEEAAIQRAVPKRRLEFAQGRAVAREALLALGVRGQAIPVGPNRAPEWPEGYVGSITHCEGFVAAVAANEDRLAAVGLDAEPARPLPPETRALVLHASELSDDPVMETLVFSTKEAIHKAIFPLTGAWLDFLDVEVTLDHQRGRFSVGPAGRVGSSSVGDVIPPELRRIRGRFVRAGDVVVTGCLVPGPNYEGSL
jgi:4'-phosphopantetheinyl transferase EntD